MSNNNFSFFKGGITSLKPTSSVSIEEAFNLIQSDKYKQSIDIIRNSEDKAIVNTQKKKLDYFTFSGVFEQRKADGLISHSSLICLDYDGVENLEKFKSNVYTNAFILMAFISPSGQGIKLIIRTDKSDNKDAWNALNAYFKKITGIEADKSGTDVCRACFVSYDPSVYYNSNAKIFKVLPKKIEKESPKNEVKIPDSELVRAKKLAERIVNGRTDITKDYDTWLKLGFALATFGENGREIYHSISQFHNDYDSKETDKKFDNCLKTNRFDNPAFFFSRAKECGLTVTKSIFAQANNVLQTNDDTLSNGSVVYDLQDYQISVLTGKSKQIVAEGFLLFIQYQTTDENDSHTWVLEIRLPDGVPIYLEVSHDDFFEPKSLEKLFGAKRLSMSINYQQLQRLRTFLFTCTEFANATKVLRYGLHLESELYFFANCAISKESQTLRPDKFGIIKYQDRHFSMPQVNRGQDSPFTFIDNTLSFNKWYKTFETAQREEMTFLSASFLLFSLFRDIGIKENGFSPMLYIYGIAGTAKSTLFNHMNYVFGSDGKSMGINLKGKNTEAAFVAKIEQRFNGYQFGDEYVPNHPLTSLFQASYDNKAYSKMNMSSKNYLDTTDLVPKCTIGFASNFLPALPNDEPFFSRLVVLVNNNRNRSEEQKRAYRELLQMQEQGITNIIREIWQYRDLIKRDFKKTYHLLKTGLENHFSKQKIGNPRYFYNVAQILTVPFILSLNEKITMCESVGEQALLEEFIQRSVSSILTSERLVQEKSSLQEFFDIIQEMFDRGQIIEGVHYKFEQKEICMNLQRLYQKYAVEFKRQNRFEILPPSIQILQDEILTLVGIDTQNDETRNLFFKKQRFTHEEERNKTDYARNSFKINYLLIQESFGIDFTIKRNTS
jgi:hypothetical protein